MQNLLTARVAAPNTWRERIWNPFEKFGSWRARISAAPEVARPAKRLALGLAVGALSYALIAAPVILAGASTVAFWVADRDADLVIGLDKDFFVQRRVFVPSPVRVEAIGGGGTFALSALGGGPLGQHALVHVDAMGTPSRVGVLGAAIDLAPGPDGGVFVVEMGLGGASSRVLYGALGGGSPVSTPKGLSEFASLSGVVCVGAQLGEKPTSGSLAGALQVLAGSDSGELTLLGEGGVTIVSRKDLASEVGDIAPAPDGGWWVLDVASPHRLLRVDRDLNLIWSAATGLNAESLSPVTGQERVWLADTTQPLVRRFGPGGILELSVPIVSSDLSRGEARKDGGFWIASPGAAVRVDAGGIMLPGQGGFSYLTDLSAATP